MPLHITMSDAAGKLTDWILSRENLTEERKAQIYEAEKSNVITKLFNASSVLLVAGVVSAIFLAISSSFVFLVLGLFLRVTTEPELAKYTRPVLTHQPAQPSQRGMWARLRDAFHAEHQTRLLQHALDQTTEEEKSQNIFDNVGLPRQEGFVRDAVLIFGFVVWRNCIQIPEVIVERREEGAGLESPAAFQPEPAPRGTVLANLAGRLAGVVAAAAAAGADAPINVS